MRIEREDDHLVLKTVYEERALANSFGARWRKERQLWELDLNLLTLSALKSSRHMIENPTEIDGIEEALLRKQAVYGNGDLQRLGGKALPPHYWHQWYGGTEWLNRKRLLLAMFMGSGKTRTILDALQTLFRDLKVHNALIVAPLSVLHVWEKQARLWVSCPYTLARVAGTMAEKQDAIQKIEKFKKENRLLLVLTNYESMIARETKEQNIEDDKTPAQERNEFFLNYKWDAVVADESLKISSRTAKITKTMIRIADKAQYVAALTGTPISSSFCNIFSQLRFVDRTCFGGNYYRFLDRYAVMGGWQGKEVKGLKPGTHEKEFWQNVRHFSIIVKPGETYPLPERSNQTREVTLTGDQLAAYREVYKEYFVEVEAIEREGNRQRIPILIRNALTKVSKLAQVASGFIIDNTGHAVRFQQNAKLVELMHLVQEIGDEKFVVFARYREELAILREALSRYCGVGAIDGSVTVANREAAIEEFNAKPAPRALVVQVQAGGFGIDLSAARIGIYWSNWWAHAVRVQSESRIWRPPNNASCVFYDLVARGTVDETILQALQEQKSVAEVLFQHVIRPDEKLEPEQEPGIQS